MKRILSSSFLLVALCGLSVSGAAQAPAQEEKPAAATDNLIVAEGTAARLSLQTQLSSKLSEVGDEVIGVLYEPMRGADGRIAVPRGTEFIGRVTQVQAAKRPQKQATLTIVFELMRMSYGAEKVATVVTAIDDYVHDEKLRSQDDEGKVGGGRNSGRTARNAGTGASLGGLAGIIGMAGGGGIGAAIGAIGVGAAGGVLVTKGNDINLQPGTILRIRFERPVTVPALEVERTPRNQ